MKKTSFFERLAGNLRFDDNEDIDEIETEETRAESRPHYHVERRELPVMSESKSEVRPAPVVEEVGELPIDLYETANEIIIQTLIAGVLPENLSIDITRDFVKISGRREESKDVSSDAYHIRELYWGSFERTVDLPEEVEIDSAEAIERHGMLIIKMPKLDKRRRTILKIKSI